MGLFLVFPVLSLSQQYDRNYFIWFVLSDVTRDACPCMTWIPKLVLSVPFFTGRMRFFSLRISSMLFGSALSAYTVTPSGMCSAISALTRPVWYSTSSSILIPFHSYTATMAVGSFV